MKLSVPRSGAYNLASDTRERGQGGRDTKGARRRGHETCRFTTIAHNVVRACNVRRIKIFIVLPRVRAGRSARRARSLRSLLFQTPLANASRERYSVPGQRWS
jgi:hypothetical protein